MSLFITYESYSTSISGNKNNNHVKYIFVPALNLIDHSDIADTKTLIYFVCRFRVMCHFICNHSYFGNIVLVCIMISSAMLAAEDPLRADSPRNKVDSFIVSSIIIYTEFLIGPWL